jgi:hypothetical protein
MDSCFFFYIEGGSQRAQRLLIASHGPLARNGTELLNPSINGMQPNVTIQRLTRQRLERNRQRQKGSRGNGARPFAHSSKDSNRTANHNPKPKNGRRSRGHGSTGLAAPLGAFRTRTLTGNGLDAARGVRQPLPASSELQRLAPTLAGARSVLRLFLFSLNCGIPLAHCKRRARQARAT